MTKKKLYFTVGIPGSGKSTYIDGLNIPIVSRDKIRFDLLAETGEYFSHETIVWKEYIRQIQEELNENGSVIADSTNLTERARCKLLNALKLNDVEIDVIYLMATADEAKARNANRTGRAYVPETAIVNMSNSLQPPTFNEKYKYSKIIEVHLDKDNIYETEVKHNNDLSDK